MALWFFFCHAVRLMVQCKKLGPACQLCQVGSSKRYLWIPHPGSCHGLLRRFLGRVVLEPEFSSRNSQLQWKRFRKWEVSNYEQLWKLQSDLDGQQTDGELSQEQCQWERAVGKISILSKFLPFHLLCVCSPPCEQGGLNNGIELNLLDTAKMASPSLSGLHNVTWISSVWTN